MSYKQLFEKLNENPKETSVEAVRLLIKIADNIMNNPKNIKIRTLNKSNPTISKKILQVSGGVMCLKLMGFQEKESCFILPSDAELTNVLKGKDALLMWKESIESVNNDRRAKGSVEKSERSSGSYDSASEEQKKTCHKSPETSKQEIIRPIVLPPFQPLYSHQFFHRMEVTFHSCLRYANKDVQERARKLIPLETIEISAQKRLRSIQEHTKKNKMPEPNISIQDMLLLELLQWFKEDFFSWVDSPSCEHCGGKTRFSHMSNDKTLLVYTNRVELHRCEQCHSLTPFARYDDLNILLETRKGRCGEWANVFTLFCYAMGWDARYVLDENDHVWTEVYSIAQQRWLHCDPCENICDKPLIYESGWKKKMTYVIAYSTEEVQDVTWRYSSNHKEVLKRRTLCDEGKLIEALIELRKRRQISMSPTRRAYLTKRLVLEMAELISERKPGEHENQGRQSGEADWRLARGEIQDDETEEFIWQVNPDNVVNNAACIRYSVANDVYEFVTGGTVKSCRNKWSSGCFSRKNITRKEEKDWKQVYLSRKENAVEGSISWKFQFQSESNRKIDTVSVHFHHATFENGIVTAKVYGGTNYEVIPSDSKMLQTKNFAGETAVTVEAILSGGKGDVAWQHAQLFRQSLNSSEFPFIINFTFK